MSENDGDGQQRGPDGTRRAPLSGRTPPGRSVARRNGLPAGWESTGDDYDYVPLRLPADVTRVTATMRLAIQAEYGGWELSRVRLYTDGSRRVLLRRRKTAVPAPGPTL